MLQKLKDLFDDERLNRLTSPFFKCLGYCVLMMEVVLWTLAYELLLFEIIPDLFHHNLLVDLLATTVGCALLMGTVRSLYGAFKIKNYIVREKSASSGNVDSTKNAKDVETSKNKRFCKICKIYKGDTYYHCSICNKCVYEMDHHCFFLANCVGGKNYRFFLSYVLYAVVNCIIHVSFYIPYIPDLVKLRFRVFHKVGIIKLTICLMMAVMAGFFTIFLLGSHIYYMTNSTSYLKDKFAKQKNSYGWKRFLLCYLRCGISDADAEIMKSYQKSFFHIFGSKSPLKAFWPDFEN